MTDKKSINDVQARINRKAQEKMNADFKALREALYTCFSSVHVEMREFCTRESAEDLSSVNISPSISAVASSLEKMFRKEETRSYQERESQLFLSKFEQMSSQFGEMIGFEEE